MPSRNHHSILLSGGVKRTDFGMDNPIRRSDVSTRNDSENNPEKSQRAPCRKELLVCIDGAFLFLLGKYFLHDLEHSSMYCFWCRNNAFVRGQSPSLCEI